ncbi:VanW family protein [Nocardioides coralli]|uniref:VanW family protein n=1 Tax=Nocardioides coralli TaxID=2872154 RepID=UPI001CA442AC|nr:VanW family protein [Nocardioides coralli]QZY28479.1 VanW family protein [Nocardioides coralli]
MSDPGRETAGGRVVLLLLLGLVVLLAGGYGAAYAAAGDKVPRGTTVAGVDIGGQTPGQAEVTLEEGLADRVDAQQQASVAGDEVTFTPEEAGLEVDYAGSVAAAGGGRSWDPARLWDYYTDGDEMDAVLDVDETRMDALLDRLEEELGTPPRDGAVKIRGTRIAVTDPRDGETIDREQARAAIEQSYLAESDAAVAGLQLTTVEPEIDAAEVRRAVEEFANPALSGPVTLRFGDADVRLLPREFGKALRLRPEDGELVPDVDRKALKKVVGNRVGTDGAPVDATIRIVGGSPRVVPAKPGVRYRQADVADTFLDLVTRPEGKRVQAVKARTARPDLTTAELRDLDITEKVSSFTTYYPHAEYRNVNIGRAAEIVDGTILEPGEVFSLNGTVGERTAENGFTEGFIISDGILVRDLGGGVSQLATTLFNAMFFAGLEDVEHKPHSFYIDRYPVGREATVAWGAVDLRFKNTTPHGVFIQSRVTPSTPSSSGVVTVDMWSTKHWDITTRTSGRYNQTEPETRRVDTVRCHPNEGYGGFDVDVWRYFSKPGSDEVVRTEKFSTTYTPSDTVICTNPNATDS